MALDEQRAGHADVQRVEQRVGEGLQSLGLADGYLLVGQREDLRVQACPFGPEAQQVVALGDQPLPSCRRLSSATAWGFRGLPQPLQRALSSGPV